MFAYIVYWLFFLVGFVFSAIGLLYVSASVWQMLRGSIIIFTGILSVSIRNCDSLSTNKVNNIIGSLSACVRLVMDSQEKHFYNNCRNPRALIG